MRRWIRSEAASARPAWVAAILLAALLGGCELSEVVIAEPEDLVVAEVLVQVREDAGAAFPRVFALLHRTADRDAGVPGARIVLYREGEPVPLRESPSMHCVASAPPGYASTCYRASVDDEIRFRPGDRLALEIDLPGGGRLHGSGRIPGDFHATELPPGQGLEPTCRIEPDTTLELRWTRSEGAWAYVSETLVRNIQAAMAERGIPMESDDIYLSGLSVSAADTTIVFPGEFGLLERFDADRDLLVALQRGLPPGGRATVSVAAVDRNYVNWARGGGTSILRAWCAFRAWRATAPDSSARPSCASGDSSCRRCRQASSCRRAPDGSAGGVGSAGVRRNLPRKAPGRPEGHGPPGAPGGP